MINYEIKDQHREMGKMERPDMEPFSIKPLNESCHRMVCPSPIIRSVINSFIFLTEGEVLVESCNNNFIVKKDEFLFIPNGVPFSIKYYKECIGYMGGFHNSFLSPDFIQPNRYRAINLLQSSTPTKEHFTEDSLRINLTLKKIMEESKSEKKNDSFIKILLLDLIYSCENITARQSKNDLGNTSSKFLELIFDESKKILTIPEYAQYFGVTQNHLNKTIKQHTGKPISEWIEESIIMRSKTLLQGTNLSIAEIAERLNILDQSYFSRKFKRHENCSPLEYRKRNKKS